MAENADMELFLYEELGPVGSYGWGELAICISSQRMIYETMCTAVFGGAGGQKEKRKQLPMLQLVKLLAEGFELRDAGQVAERQRV
jgi:hypothetical protein